MGVSRVQVEVGKLDVVQPPGRGTPQRGSSRPAQIRQAWEVEMPQSMPIASARSSTLRVAIPWTSASINDRIQRLVDPAARLENDGE